MNNKDITIIVTDTETTGLCKPIPAELIYQPFIVELYACKMDGDLNFVDEFETYIKPPIPIPPESTKIHNITDDMVASAPTFAEAYDDLYDYFRGADIVVGQNIEYDVNVIHYELMRHDWEKKFCWPKRHVCTIEASYHYQNKKLNLQKLHEFLFGEGFEDGHRAKSDVMATVRCFIELVKRGDIIL